MKRTTRRAAPPPVESTHPHFIRYYVDGGTLGAHPHVRGVYWSVRCEPGVDGTTPEILREQSAEYASNNDAEWLALRAALRHAVERFVAVRPVVIYSDSQLVVKQFNGAYQAKVPRHFRLREECRALAGQLPFVVVEWVPRAVSVAQLGH